VRRNTTVTLRGATQRRKHVTKMTSTLKTVHSPWIVREPKTTATRVRLFCLPHAGGAASMYRRWQAAFPSEIEVCALQLPGRASRWSEPLVSDAHRLAEAAAEAILPHLDQPFVLFGHSMGALLAFEVARSLRRRAQREPSLLVASGRCAPHCPAREARIAQLPEREFVERLQARYNAIPAAVLAEPELMRFVVPLLRADLTLLENYGFISEAPLRCRVAAFGGVLDSLVPREDLEAWREQTNGSFSLRLFHTGHFFTGDAEDAVMRAVAEEIALSLEATVW
jgi:medium-chain acyl-[acyl-carrier-protein] hydrolase